MATSSMMCLRRATTGLFISLVISQQWIMSVLDQSLGADMLVEEANAVAVSVGTISSSSATRAPVQITRAMEEIPRQNQPKEEARQPEKAPEAPQNKQQKEENRPQQSKSKLKGQRPPEKAQQPDEPQEIEAERRAKKRERFREWHRQKAERLARKEAEQQKQEKSKQNDNTVNHDDLHPFVPPPTEEEQQKRGFWYPHFYNAKFSPTVEQVLNKYEVRKRQEPPVSLQQLQEIVKQTKTNPHSWNPYGSPQSTSDASHQIQHIYYTNLAKNLVRREITETYLKELQQTTQIPFKRMEAKKGDTDVCTPKNFDTKCIGVSGLAYSLLNILETQNVTGPTLVVEDDWVWQDSNFDRLYTAMDMLPDDWDILRFDCWELSQKQFAATIADPYLINTTTYTTPSNEWCQNDRLCARRFYGGTHAMLWRGRTSSNSKLKQTWSIRPYDDVDGRISTEGGRRFGLISYCLNLGLGSFIEIPTEVSDIPKEEEETSAAASR